VSAALRQSELAAGGITRASRAGPRARVPPVPGSLDDRWPLGRSAGRPGNSRHAACRRRWERRRPLPRRTEFRALAVASRRRPRPAPAGSTRRSGRDPRSAPGRVARRLGHRVHRANARPG
jgi:hypothetical protein